PTARRRMGGGVGNAVTAAAELPFGDKTIAQTCSVGRLVGCNGKRKIIVSEKNWKKIGKYCIQTNNNSDNYAAFAAASVLCGVFNTLPHTASCTARSTSVPNIRAAAVYVGG
ncbi:unnamed protein product, partial [Ceratitis capitata]